MKIWVLIKKERLKTNHSRRFKEEAEKLGIKLRHVLAEDFEIVEPVPQQGKIWYRGRYVKTPDCLITRTSSTNYFTLALIRYLQNMGVQIMNKASAIEAAEDKLRTIQILAKHQVPIPKTILAKFPVDEKYIADQLGIPLVLKTTFGLKGEGVLKFNTQRQLREITRILQNSTEGKTHLIFQKCIEETFGRDIRVMVIGGKAVGAALRQGAAGQFKANVARGGHAEKIELTPEIAKIAEQATKTLGLDISGVDLLFGEKGLLVAEVNSTPSFYGFEQCTGQNITAKILNYALRRLQKKV